MQSETLSEIASSLNNAAHNYSTELKSMINNIMNSNYNFEFKQNLLLQLNSIVLTGVMALKGVHKVIQENTDAKQH